MRINNEIAVRWVDYRRAIASADHVPEDAYLVRADAGNLAVVDADGTYLGFIDAMAAEVEIP